MQQAEPVLVCLHQPSSPSCSPTCFWMLSGTWILKCVYIQFRTDGDLFNLKCLQSRTKTQHMLIRDLFYADDCAMVAHTLEDIQQITNAFARAAERFGLTISIKKTEVMYQPAPRQPHSDPVVTISKTPLKSFDKFCYLGSIR